ncbi:Glutathione S-transferase [Colletotrichum higginsianum IMI 349063]|uniref:Glutathione S-transferase n=2 Tax=Colletotrichum higginsianum TaxID=80884 RepID=A0A1B7YFJ9_COLHI|nr:Glutathione S-transferase [Colletotrichum higginsianum IMI 349063]OBR10795.1 Glutathione S-transferase [Colletotrichum higginsianum IMI 349063]TID06505.1 Glutathione S-transferase 1 [Colletotrichum higginsianum]
MRPVEMLARRCFHSSQLARGIPTSQLKIPLHSRSRFAHPSRVTAVPTRSLATTRSPPAMASEDLPKVKLYWLNDSRSQNTLWLLEELRIPYTVQTFRREPNRLAPPELADVHPLGKAPVLEITPAADPAGTSTPATAAAPPIRLAESGYITQYLVDHFGHRSPGLVPPRWKPGQEGRIGGETEAYARFQYLLHYVEGSFFPVIVQYLLISVLKSSNVPFLVRPLTSAVASKIYSLVLFPTAQKHLAMLESLLKTAPGVASSSSSPSEAFLCGPDLTAADILISFALVTAETEGAWDAMGHWPGGSARAAHPVLFEYIDRLRRQPGYLKVVEKVKEIEA